MSKTKISIALCLIVLLWPAVPRAEHVAGHAPEGAVAEQASIDALVSSIRANRKAMVAANLDLTDGEATAFWPLYDKYQKEIGTVGDRFLAVIDEYSKAFPNVPDDRAVKLMEDYLATEADRVSVRRTYLPEFAKVLPGRKVARLYQIENKMDAVIRYELASTIPVVDEKAAAAPK